MAFMTKKWTGTEYFKVRDFDHVEFYVGNAKQVVHFYRSAFGFRPYAYSGPETGVRDRVSYVLKQNNIYFVFTTPLSSTHPASEWLSRHGDGVYDIAIQVSCDKEAHDSCISRGAESVMCPTVTEDKNGKFGSSLNQQNKNKNQTFYESTRKFYDEYLEYCGFPEVVLTKQSKNKILKIKDIFKSYFEKDVKNLAAFSKINSFRDLILLLAHLNGEKLDITRLSSEIGVSRMTVYSYLSFLKETYFIRLVSPFSRNVNRKISGTKKVYFCDHGIANHCVRVDKERLFKNCVFNNLIKLGRVNYYQKRSGEEINFILNKRIGIEVKMMGLESNLRKLNKICKKIGLN